MVSTTRNEPLDIEISAFLFKMVDSKWPPLFFDTIIFLDEIKNKIDRDKIEVYLPMFSGARNTVAVSICKFDHWVIQKSKWPP